MAPALALHLPAALAALVVGGWILLRPKGTPAHRAAGRVWLALMLVVTITSLWLPAFLAFGSIHALTLLSLTAMGVGLVAIRRGNRRVHRGWMIGGYLGLIGAGVGALAPHRLLGGAIASALGLR